MESFEGMTKWLFTCPDRSQLIYQQLADAFFAHHDSYTHKPMRNKYNVIQRGDEQRVEECRELVVHEFTLGEVEDPDLHAAEPLWQWQQSEHGQWVMKHAADVPTWHRQVDPNTYGYQYKVTAKFMGATLTEMLLRQSK